MCPYPLHCTTCDFLKLYFVCFLLSKLFLKKQTEDRILSDSDNGNNYKKQEYKLLFLFLKMFKTCLNFQITYKWCIFRCLEKVCLHFYSNLPNIDYEALCFKIIQLIITHFYWILKNKHFRRFQNCLSLTVSNFVHFSSFLLSPYILCYLCSFEMSIFLWVDGDLEASLSDLCHERFWCMKRKHLIKSSITEWYWNVR